MIASALTRSIGIMMAAAALCAAVAGCVSDMGAAISEKPDGASQLRYYGGPKSPMWPGQQASPTSERFPAKWGPVRVKKTRQNKELEHPLRFNRNGKGSGKKTIGAT
jgi:hypothetical protein